MVRAVTVTFELQGLDHVALAVRDVERSATWYEEVLGLERRFAEVWGNHPAVLGVGATSLALFPVAGPDPMPRPDRNVLAMRHFAFRVDRSNFRNARRVLEQRGIDLEFQDHGLAHSYYFSDPDGHQIEITTYDV
jgi:catechol 2,3-dioxygenase-like lactoylglutathione lyase family enzyme